MLQRIEKFFVKRIGIDKILHFLACAVIVFSFSVFLPVWAAILIAAILGVAKEVYDYYKGTGIDLFDLIADAIGIIYAVTILML